MIPYVYKISKQLMFNTKDTKFSVSFIGLNKLSNIVKVQKDKLAYDSQSGMVC